MGNEKNRQKNGEMSPQSAVSACRLGNNSEGSYQRAPGRASENEFLVKGFYYRGSLAEMKTLPWGGPAFAGGTRTVRETAKVPRKQTRPIKRFGGKKAGANL